MLRIGKNAKDQEDNDTHPEAGRFLITLPSRTPRIRQRVSRQSRLPSRRHPAAP
jgi:hypothetical protein